MEIVDGLTLKQWTERYALDAFKEFYSDFPDGEIINGDKPDFIINNGIRKIGIDVFDVFQDSHLSKSSKLKQSQSVQTEFENDLIKAISKYRRKGIALGVDFNRWNVLTAARKDAVIMGCLPQCLEFVCNHEKGFTRIQNHPYRIDPLPDEIDAITILLVNREESYGTISMGGTYPTLEYKHIEPKLLKHEKAMTKYEPCDQQWLLIREGNYFPGTFSDFTDITLEAPTKFDKVFIVRTGRREVIILK